MNVEQTTATTARPRGHSFRDGALAGFPRIYEMTAAGMSLPTAIALWNEMWSELDLGVDYWWALVEAAGRECRSARAAAREAQSPQSAGQAFDL